VSEIKGCLFDLDGVIVDTAKYHFQAWGKLAEELGITFTEEDNERLKGVSRMKSLEIILELGGKEFGEPEKIKLTDRKNAWYRDLISTMTPDEALPGAIDLLKDLQNNDMLLAIGSSSKNAMLILDRVDLFEYFESIVDGTLISKAKPDPEVFLKGAESLHLEPKDCIVFEDAIAGIEAAQNGNMRTVGVGLPEVLTEADFVVGSLKELSFEKLKAVFS